MNWIRRLFSREKKFTVVGFFDDETQQVFVAWYRAQNWQGAAEKAREEYGEEPEIVEIFTGWQYGLYAPEEDRPQGRKGEQKP